MLPGSFSVRIMRLSGKVCHDAGGLMSQWGSSIKSPWVHTVTNWYLPLPTGLVPQLWSTASYLTWPLVSSSSATIITVLWPVPFPKCSQATVQQYKLPIDIAGVLVIGKTFKRNKIQVIHWPVCWGVVEDWCYETFIMWISTRLCS